MTNVRNTKPGYALVISKYAFLNTFSFAPSKTGNNTRVINKAFKAFAVGMDRELRAVYAAKWLGVGTCEFANQVETFAELYPYGDRPSMDVYKTAVNKVADELQLQYKTN